jgi:chlorite dismutase
MAEKLSPPLALEGWYVLHQFIRIHPPLEGDDAGRNALATLAGIVAGWEDLGEDGWTGVYRVVGGGSDYLVMHLRPHLEGLGKAERVLRRHPGAASIEVVDDYLSVVELGLYALTQALREKAALEEIEAGSEAWTAMVEEAMAQEREKKYVQDRLQPRQPDEMPYISVYPMDKRRNPGQNWYTEPFEERAAMMAAHGQTGRGYAGRISQIITGSVGLDDWEWAVTLFGTDPLQFKSLLTEMRYDRVSSEFAEFGRFWTGYRIAGKDLVREWMDD